jgi:hypothetical protein
MASTDATIAKITKGGVELRDSWYEAEIEDYPHAEHGKVQVDEPHASGETGDRVGDAHLERRGDLLAVSSHLHRADIAHED